jgi:hypothetical protein
MKDLLGREIMRGDTLACVAREYSQYTVRHGIQLVKVVDLAPFAIQVVTVGEADVNNRRVVTNTSKMAIVEMNRSVWGVDASGNTGA